MNENKLPTIRLTIPMSRAQIRTEELTNPELPSASLWQVEVTSSPGCLQRLEELIQLGLMMEQAQYEQVIKLK